MTTSRSAGAVWTNRAKRSPSLFSAPILRAPFAWFLAKDRSIPGVARPLNTAPVLLAKAIVAVDNQRAFGAADRELSP